MKRTYEIWCGSRLIHQVRGPINMTAQEAKSKAIDEAKMLGIALDSFAPITNGEVFYRDANEQKVKVS